jgi:hypothetical protein
VGARKEIENREGRRDLRKNREENERRTQANREGKKKRKQGRDCLRTRKTEHDS